MATASTVDIAKKEHWLNYRTIWRWHFYAGLFCIPFVLWLATTGSIYLFKPQIEAWLDRPYDNLPIAGSRASASEQVKAAVAAVPGANFHYYQMPQSERSAVQVIVGRHAEEYRVYVNPYTLQVMKVIDQDARLMPRISHLHGELLIGDRGSYIVETAASWAIIMILTGLYLWWPREARGFAGVLYPRLKKGQRIFWRDIHAVTGFWVSSIALLFLLSGLPWAKSWGAYLKAARRVTNQAVVHQDWTTGTSSEKAERLALDRNSLAASDEHAAHHGHSGEGGLVPATYLPINRMIGTVAQLHLAFPVLIAPPMRLGGSWTAKSDSQDRVLRDQVTLDQETGAVLTRFNFNQRPLLDRMVGIGVAAHEGHLFGWLNQLLNLCTALGLITLCLSAAILWWRRKPEGALGAPVKSASVRFTGAFVVMLIALAVYMPFFGLTLLSTILLERFVLRRIPATRNWLGLGAVKHA